MPYIPDSTAVSTPTLQYETDEAALEATQSARDSARPGWLGGLIGSVGLGTTVNLVDQTLSSIPFIGPEQGAINQRFLDAIGSPGLRRFAEEQQGATDLVSGLVGIFAADKIATKIFAPGSAVSRGLAHMPGVRNIAALDRQYSAALRAAQMGSREIAARGEMGAQTMNGILEYKSLGVPVTIDLAKARSGVQRISALRKGGEFAATELVMAGIMNSNSVFYSDDYLENLAWMGLGVGIGAGIGFTKGGWQLRRAATSKATESEFIQAYDWHHHEASRMTVGKVDDTLGKAWLGYGQELNTSILTSQMLHAAEARLPVTETAGGAQRATRLQTNRSTFATGLEAEAMITLNKITTPGLAGVTKTGFNDSTSAFSALRSGVAREPTLLMNASEVGVANPSLGIHQTNLARTAAIESRMDALSKIIKDGGFTKIDPQTKKVTIQPLTSAERLDIQMNLRKLWYQNSLQPFVQLIPGELMPMEFGRAVDNIIPRRVFKDTKAGKSIWEAERMTYPNGQKSTTIGVGSDGAIYLPKGLTPATMRFDDTVHLYRTLRKAADGIAKGSTVMTLPNNPNWIQLDLAEQILRRTDNPSIVTFPNGMTREDAIVESFAQKVDDIRKSYKDLNTPGNDIDAFWARVKFNLLQFTPQQSALFRTHETPVDTLLYSFKNGDEVRKLGYDKLKKLIREAAEIQGLTDDTLRSFEEMTGRSYDFLMDEAGDAIEPVMIYKRPTDPNDWTRDALDYQIATRKAFQRGHLLGPTADPRVKVQTEALLASPDFHEALRISSLADNQNFSWIPGLTNKAPQSIFGAMTDALNVAGRQFRDRDSQTLLSASRVKDLQDRIARAQMAQTTKEIMGDIMTRVAAPRAGQTRVLLNQFFSQRQGWTIAEALDESGQGLNKGDVREVALPSGQPGYKFKLANNEANKSRWEQQFGEPMPKDAYLPNAQGTDMVIDKLSMEAVSRFENLTEVRRSMQNTILRAKGMSEIQRQYFWVPSPETHGKFVAFAFDDQNRIIQGSTIIANTQEQLAELTAKATKESWFKPGYTIRSRDQVTSFMDLWDKAQMDWHDATSTVVQSGRTSRGTLTGRQVDMKAWERANKVMVDGFIDASSDAFNHLTKDAVLGAAVRAEVGRAETAISKSNRQQKYGGVFDRYIQNITGRPASANRQGFISPIFNAMEDRINNFLQDTTPNSSKVYTALADYLRMIPWSQNLGARENNKKLFQKLTRDLGPYMPFKNVTDMIEAQTGNALPKEIKEISAKISWAESTSKLRWFESMHAVMNFASLIHNIPSIQRGLQRISGETDEQWAKRIGHVASIFGEQHEAAVINPGKLTFLAFKDAWKPTFDEFTEKAFARGFMDQEVSEIERQFNSIKTPGAIRAWVFGDPKGSTALARKGGLDHYLGYMSDASENYSRRVGMYAGRRVAKLHGIENVDDQVAFAHQFTNDMIANYDPRNRPEIFQGWLGAPIGLFQSYIANYYGRMFRLIETGNNPALMSQALWQSAVFGTKSFGPFWDQANSMFFDKGGVLSEDANDSFEHRLGTTEADILMYGVISNLPKLFGGDGMSIYTRGDINVRLPIVNMPIAATAKRVWQGWSRAIDAVANNTEGLTSQQLAEILSNSLGNRPLAGLIETFGAGGFDTDAAGQVISESENIASLNTVYRLMGIRSLEQQKAIDAFYADKTAGEHQAAAQTTLRLETRANIRAGNLDALPNLFVKYVENGGDVKYFTRWYNDAMKSALKNRSQRRLDDLMKNEKKMASVNRLLDAGVTPTMEAESDDYGAEEIRKQETKAKVDEMLSVYDLQ